VTPEQLTALVRRISERFDDAQTAVVVILARYLRRDLEADDWAELRGLDRAKVQREIRAVVRALRSATGVEVAKVLQQSYALSGQEAAQMLAVAGVTRSLAEGAVAAAASRRALAALVSDLGGRLAATEARILRTTDDVYRQVIARATTEGLLGRMTRRQVAQAALNEFAERGITGFIDAAGRSWNLASYTEMATRTAAINASRLGKLDAMRARGHDLAIISGNSAGCDACAPWEGEVVSIDGKTPEYPTLADAEADGLFHPNCGHQPDPYVEGVTEEQTEVRSDPERYAALQQQRYLERGVRQYKMRAAAALDDQAKAAANAKVREWQGRLREHTSKHDLPRLYYREQISKAI
jgi:hypothetical protein